MITTAYINIWNKRVGAIAWDDSNGLASFEYETSFLANNWDLAPLKMSIFGADKQVFSFPELRGFLKHFCYYSKWGGAKKNTYLHSYIYG